MPQYKLVGERFSTSLLRTTVGPVVASADAFFLIPASNELLAASLMHVAPIPLPAGSTNWDVTSRSDFSASLELLTEITNHPDWPVTNISSGPIFMIPRTSVSSFKYRWYGAMTLQTSERRFVVTPDAGFFPKGTKKFLTDHGWLG